MRRTATRLLFALAACLATVAPAAAQAPADELQAARARTCAQFQSEVSRFRATGMPRGETPSFAIIWASLLKSEAAKGRGLEKMAQGQLMYDFTFDACGRNRSRTLGSVMDEVFASL